LHELQKEFRVGEGRKAAGKGIKRLWKKKIHKFRSG